MVSETSRWLRKNFVVNTIHAGKPPTTWLTAPVNLLLARFRKLWRRPSPAHSVEKPSTKPDGEIEEIKGVGALVYAIRSVSLAWDRRALLLKARRAVANGEIIVSDRYPTNVIGLMDSPRLRENATQKGWVAKVYNRLAKIEQGLYRQIPPPDIVIRLNVSLDIAKKRNAAREIVDDEVYLQSRHQQAKAWFMDGTRSIQDVNTDAPKAETLCAVKQAIWPYL
jgi:thymidylate kinase